MTADHNIELKHRWEICCAMLEPFFLSPSHPFLKDLSAKQVIKQIKGISLDRNSFKEMFSCNLISLSFSHLSRPLHLFVFRDCWVCGTFEPVVQLIQWYGWDYNWVTSKVDSMIQLSKWNSWVVQFIQWNSWVSGTVDSMIQLSKWNSWVVQFSQWNSWVSATVESVV